MYIAKTALRIDYCTLLVQLCKILNFSHKILLQWNALIGRQHFNVKQLLSGGPKGGITNYKCCYLAFRVVHNDEDHEDATVSGPPNCLLYSVRSLTHDSTIWYDYQQLSLLTAAGWSRTVGSEQCCCKVHKLTHTGVLLFKWELL